jgi:hypothetical protein
MRKGNLTRAEAVAIVGEAAVARAEAANCEPTNRVGYNGSIQGEDLIEWSGSASAEDTDGTACTVTAYYYTTQDEIDAAGDDLSNVDWNIAGYEVV